MTMTYSLNKNLLVGVRGFPFLFPSQIGLRLSSFKSRGVILKKKTEVMSWRRPQRNHKGRNLSHVVADTSLSLHSSSLFPAQPESSGVFQKVHSDFFLEAGNLHGGRAGSCRRAQIFARNQVA